MAAMLKGFLSEINKKVPPVPSPKNHREPLQPAPLLAVPPVPPEKTKTKAESEKTINPKDKAAILRWLHYIGETDQAVIDDVLDYCTGNPEALAYYLKRAEEVPPPDDRRHCRECLNLNSRGYCIRQRFRPVDDLPRRCEDFRADAPLNNSRNNP
jgi:hypothetical protein